MKILREKLPENLYYHTPEHTMDVISSVERIAVSEGCNTDEVLLLKVSALFHDAGYTRDKREHEKHGCFIAIEMLGKLGVSKQDIDAVCALIMATKVPQQPQSKLEKIICDADLDYLGRNDYFTIAENLFREFVACGKIKDERDWMQLQLEFLQAHKYFTDTCKKTRQPVAEENLKKILEQPVNR